MYRYTYLNKAGRTVVLVRMNNMLDALSLPLYVRYKLPPFAWAREPALWAASLAALLAAVVRLLTPSTACHPLMFHLVQNLLDFHVRNTGH